MPNFEICKNNQTVKASEGKIIVPKESGEKQNNIEQLKNSLHSLLIDTKEKSNEAIDFVLKNLPKSAKSKFLMFLTAWSLGAPSLTAETEGFQLPSNTEISLAIASESENSKVETENAKAYYWNIVDICNRLDKIMAETTPYEVSIKLQEKVKDVEAFLNGSDVKNIYKLKDQLQVLDYQIYKRAENYLLIKYSVKIGNDTYEIIANVYYPEGDKSNFIDIVMPDGKIFSNFVKNPELGIDNGENDFVLLGFGHEVDKFNDDEIPPEMSYFEYFYQKVFNYDELAKKYSDFYTADKKLKGWGRQSSENQKVIDDFFLTKKNYLDAHQEYYLAKSELSSLEINNKKLTTLIGAVEQALIKQDIPKFQEQLKTLKKEEAVISEKLLIAKKRVEEEKIKVEQCRKPFDKLIDENEKIEDREDALTDLADTFRPVYK
ncbi:MAG: hypothetical protein WC249_01895 [Patescibacteria group bacterium]|jgi:hypothetical protein